jgi:hypothetical protein
LRRHEVEAWFVITTAISIVPAAPLPVWATILSCEARQVARPAVVVVAPVVVVEPVEAVVEVLDVPDPVPEPVPDPVVVVVVLVLVAAVVEQAASATAAAETRRVTERRRPVTPGRNRRYGAPGRAVTGRSPRA